MKQESTKVIEHDNFQGEYRILRLAAPVTGPQVEPGQFLGLQVPNLGERILRRPFSIYQADETGVAVLYKAVGKGTDAMANIKVGDEVDIIGPLGNGYPAADNAKIPVLVAGGYGNAALYILAQRMEKKGIAFFGGRSAIDILLVKEFEELGWDVRPTTDDGSLGIQGLVTDAFDPWAAQQNFQTLEVFCCGPNPMLKAIGDRAIEHDFTAWLSIDRHMACGVGACLTCVIKRKTEEENHWEWSRCCKDGPIYESREVLWDE